MLNKVNVGFMSQHDLQKVVDDFYEKLNLKAEETTDRFQVGIWLPIEFKPKYETIQKCTKKKFTKLLRGLLIQAIEKVVIEEAS